MKNKAISSVKSIFLFGLAFFSVLVFVGCRDVSYIHIPYSNGDDYKIFTTTKEGVPYFSFEYPSNYQLSDRTEPGNMSMYVGLFGVPIEEFYGGRIKDIQIQITNVDQKYLGFPDAETAVKEHISNTKWSWIRNYRLKEKHSVIIDGLKGWETIITYRERPFVAPGDDAGKPREPVFIVQRDVFFDYQGMTWQISLFTDADSYEQQTKADFEHILRTFKVLD